MNQGHYEFSDLESLCVDAELVDQHMFSEMRSNLLLIDGEHYSRRHSDFYRRLRTTRELTDEVKLRLTKNHTQKIVRTYVNNIVSLAPGITFDPVNQNELKDQKDAELHKKLYEFAREKYDMDTLIEDWADDLCGVGECATKIFWDPLEGDVVAYKQKLHDDTKEPLFNDDGSPTKGDPVYSGAFNFETIYGFNLLRAPETRDIRKSPYLIIRKMVDKKKLLAQFGDDPEKEKYITTGLDQTMVIFDVDKNLFRRTVNEVYVREIYFRPCVRYPNGYFYITTKRGILSEGELPGAIFPIAVGIFERLQTSPRGRGPVKTIRPFQAEINRCASKIAEHQMSLGDDKLITQSGTKISQGVALPGVRHITTTGGEPTVLMGRDGSQYFQHAMNTVTELYQIMNMPDEVSDTTSDSAVEPYTLLFRSTRQKKKFSRYVRRFERFLVEMTKIYVALCKVHMSDDMLISIFGKDEACNLDEFKDPEKICYKIKVAPGSEDMESQFGKQLVMNQILQFAGAKLSPEDIGAIIESMPYGNSKQITQDLTINRRSSTNDILALDRGKKPPIHEYDDHQYFIKRFVARVREPDFDTLSPQIKKNYADNIKQRELIVQAQIEKIQAMKDGMIPTSGYLVVCDLYVPDPVDPEKSKRARVPYDSLKWLLDTLEKQGKPLDQLETMNQGALSEMAGQLHQKAQNDAMNGGPMSMHEGAPPMSPNQQMIRASKIQPQ